MINTLSKKIYKDVSKFVFDNFETVINSKEIKEKIESYKECINIDTKSPFTVMKNFQNEIKFKFNAKELHSKDTLLRYIDLYHNDIVSELSNEVSSVLLSDRVFSTEEDMIDKYLNNSSDFWMMIKDNISEAILNRAAYDYHTELSKLDSVKKMMVNLDKYNFAQKLNRITANVLIGIQKSINDQRVSVKKVVYETEVCNYSIPAEFNVVSNKVLINGVEIFLDTIRVDDKGYEENIFSLKEVA